MNSPSKLQAVHPFDTQTHDGYAIESAFLDFTDWLGRANSVYVARCFPLDAPTGAKLPVVLHLPGGGQTVYPADLAWWAKHGFAAAGVDWQIGAIDTHPQRKSRFASAVMSQHTAYEREEQAVFPVAIEACGVLIDWMATHPQVDAQRVGVTGISWGGFLTWAVNAHEPRIKAAAPVYGCGGLFLPTHAYGLSAKGPVRETYLREWDGANLGHRQIGPVCYLSSTNDFFGYHTIADKLVTSLRVDRRRSSQPNNDHHLGPGEAALGVAWFNHYLAGGPAPPKEPTLRHDLTIDADDSSPIERTEVWWTACDGPDDFFCWVQGVPRDLSEMKLAFGRVYYKSGITLNTPTLSFTSTKTPGSLHGTDVWPAATDGLTYGWGLRSTQYYRTDLWIEPLPGDATRCAWKIDRPGGGPFSPAFRGPADPRWNDGKFATLELDLDLQGATIQNPQVQGDFVCADGKRHVEVVAPSLTVADGRLRFVVRPEDFPKRPAGAGWREVKQITLMGTISGNRAVLGPFRKRRA